MFFKADGSYTQVYLSDHSTLKVSKGLKNFVEVLLMHKQFFRCHKSFLVNTNYISEYIRSDGGYLLIDNQFQVSHSLDKTQQLMRFLKV